MNTFQWVLFLLGQFLSFGAPMYEPCMDMRWPGQVGICIHYKTICEPSSDESWDQKKCPDIEALPLSTPGCLTERFRNVVSEMFTTHRNFVRLKTWLAIGTW